MRKVHTTTVAVMLVAGLLAVGHATAQVTTHPKAAAVVKKVEAPKPAATPVVQSATTTPVVTPKATVKPTTTSTVPTTGTTSPKAK